MQPLGGHIGILQDRPVRTAAPQVLLMDEPFGALDSLTRSVMQEILTNMWQRLRLIRAMIRDESVAAMGSELSRGGLGGLSTELGAEGVCNIL